MLVVDVVRPVRDLYMRFEKIAVHVYRGPYTHAGCRMQVRSADSMQIIPVVNSLTER